MAPSDRKQRLENAIAINLMICILFGLQYSTCLGKKESSYVLFLLVIPSVLNSHHQVPRSSLGPGYHEALLFQGC